MLEIPFHPRFIENQERATDHPLCAICGKHAPNPGLPYVHMWYGTTLVTEAEAAHLRASESGWADLGYWAVGRDCLRKHPELQPYLLTEPLMGVQERWETGGRAFYRALIARYKTGYAALGGDVAAAAAWNPAADLNSESLFSIACWGRDQIAALCGRSAAEIEAEARAQLQAAAPPESAIPPAADGATNADSADSAPPPDPGPAQPYEAGQQLIAEFLEYLEQQGYVICERDVRRHPIHEGVFVPITTYNHQALTSTVAAFWMERFARDERSN